MAPCAVERVSFVYVGRMSGAGGAPAAPVHPMPVREMQRAIPFLFTLLLATGAPAAAQGAAQEASSVLVGARVRLMVPDLTRGWIVGRMVYADSATVIIDPNTVRWGRPLALDQAMVTRVQVSRGRIGTLRNRGAIIGALVGLGAGIYSTVAVEREDGVTGGWVLVPFFTVGGAAVGAGIGIALPEEDWDPVPVPVRVSFRPGERSAVSVAATLPF